MRESTIKGKRQSTIKGTRVHDLRSRSIIYRPRPRFGGNRQLRSATIIVLPSWVFPCRRAKFRESAATRR